MITLTNEEKLMATFVKYFMGTPTKLHDHIRAGYRTDTLSNEITFAIWSDGEDKFRAELVKEGFKDDKALVFTAMADTNASENEILLEIQSEVSYTLASKLI